MCNSQFLDPSFLFQTRVKKTNVKGQKDIIKKKKLEKNIFTNDFTEHWWEYNFTLDHIQHFLLTDKKEHKWPELVNSIFEDFFLLLSTVFTSLPHLD